MRNFAFVKYHHESKNVSGDLESSKTSLYIDSIFFIVMSLLWGKVALMLLSFLRIARFSNLRKAASPTA